MAQILTICMRQVLFWEKSRKPKFSGFTFWLRFEFLKSEPKFGFRTSLLHLMIMVFWKEKHSSLKSCGHWTAVGTRMLFPCCLLWWWWYACRTFASAIWPSAVSGIWHVMLANLAQLSFSDVDDVYKNVMLHFRLYWISPLLVSIGRLVFKE